MRLRVLGDLHLEFGEFSLPPAEADVVVLAGDIHQGVKGLEWIRRQFPKQPVVMIAGNHEFYHQSVPSFVDQIREASREFDIHFLENEAVELCGFTFLGCTLWTDFRLFGDNMQVDGWAQAAAIMNDFRLIRTDVDGRTLRSKETVVWHEASRRWLEAELARHEVTRTIVVTHHAPSQRSTPARHAGQLLNAAFTSNLDELVERSKVPMWIHGHTHHSTRYTIGRTQVLSNQRGYRQDGDKEFDPTLTVEL
jgi:predicted phosphohydrolase